MSGQASLTKLCSFTQAVPGCNKADPNNPVDVMLMVVVDAAGNPIPVDSELYPVGTSGFTGDGSGFIRSFYTDMTMNPITTSSVTFSTRCCVTSDATAPNDELVHRTVSLLGGKLLVRFGDVDETTPPVATLAPGKVTITWAATQTPQSARFVGTPADLSSNEFIVETSGGKDAANHSQTDATGFWPFVQYQKRTRLSISDPFEQFPEDVDDSLNIFNLPIATPGVVQTRLTGISGDFGVMMQW